MGIKNTWIQNIKMRYKIMKNHWMNHIYQQKTDSMSHNRNKIVEFSRTVLNLNIAIKILMNLQKKHSTSN